jgi:N-acetylneuraminic acid mutarotase
MLAGRRSRVFLAVAIGLIGALGSVALASAGGVWHRGTRMPVATGSMAAVTAPDGTLYVFGGWTTNFGMPLSVAEAYHPGSGHWTKLPPMPVASGDVSAAMGRDGRSYVTGGLDITGSPQTVLQVYDPRSRTWHLEAPMLSPQGNAAVVAGDDGRIYVIGGFPSATGASIATVEAYDPAGNHWSFRAPLPAPRGEARAAELGGRIYVLGGLDAQTNVVSTVEVYDPEHNTWSYGAPMLRAVSAVGVVTTDGDIIAVGGFVWSNALPVATVRSVQRYDPGDHRWTLLTALPQPAGGVAAGAVGEDHERLVVAGGLTFVGSNIVALSRTLVTRL